MRVIDGRGRTLSINETFKYWPGEVNLFPDWFRDNGTVTTSGGGGGGTYRHWRVIALTPLCRLSSVNLIICLLFINKLRCSRPLLQEHRTCVASVRRDLGGWQFFLI